MATLDNSLRIAQVVLNIITVCSGLMTSITLGWTVKVFSENCILYTNMKLIQGANHTVTIDNRGTKWAGVEICYYCVFTSVVAAIYAIIWFWFYLLLSEWETSYNFDKFSMIKSFKHGYTAINTERPSPDRKLFVPTLLINIVLFICCAVSLGMITRGGREWCDSVSYSLGKPCSFLSQANWIIPNGDIVYKYLKVAQAGAWILLMAVLAKVVIICSRLQLHLRTDISEEKPSTKKVMENNQSNLGDNNQSFEGSSSETLQSPSRISDQPVIVHNTIRSRRFDGKQSTSQAGGMAHKEEMVGEETKLLESTNSKKYHTY